MQKLLYDKMTEIELKFKTEMMDAIEQNKKICTCRESIHGTNGDTFKTRTGHEYIILGTIKTTLKRAIEEYYSLEGFKSPEEFFDYWIKIKEISNIYEFTRTYHKKPAYIHFFAPK